MNKARAHALRNELRDRPVGGWTIQDYLDHGKSAAVFIATDEGGTRAALKIFDPELVEECGRPQQLARIERELTLVGHSHPHLVQVLAGGACASTRHLYVVTGLLEGWTNVERCLTSIPVGAVERIIEQVASAALFLHDRRIVHRDIKPANVVVSSDYSRAVLLDLGVVRVLDAPSTGRDEFIGTLRYSSPEFLVREEADSPEGGLAVTFYQLGALLHDLLVRRPIFADCKPYAKMVEAVKTTVPEIPPECDRDLARVARNCLVKDPEQRRRLVDWSDFISSQRKMSRSTDRLRDRLRARVRNAPSSGVGSRAPSGLAESVDRARSLLQDLCTSEGSIPPISLRLDRESELRCRVELVLAASASHCLCADIHIAFDFSVSDSTSEAVELSALATRGDQPASGSPRKSTVGLDSQVLADQMFHIVLMAIDVAQTSDSDPLLSAEEEELR